MKRETGSLEQKLLSDDATGELYTREANTVIGNSVHASFARPHRCRGRRKERKREKKKKGKGKKGKKLSIAFIIRESHDNEKATRVFTRVS